MNRKEFLKSTCKLGLCSCAGIAIFSQKKMLANSDDSKIKELNSKIEFIHNRFAKLIGIIDSKLNEEMKNEILVALGRACAAESKNYLNRFQNNLKGFLNDIQKRWIENIDFKEKEKTINLYGKKTNKCGCPFVKTSLIPMVFCNCSLGWQKEAFEAVIGKPVEVKIEESILRGGERCSFNIKIT